MKFHVTAVDHKAGTITFDSGPPRFAPGPPIDEADLVEFRLIPLTFGVGTPVFLWPASRRDWVRWRGRHTRWMEEGRRALLEGAPLVLFSDEPE